MYVISRPSYLSSRLYRLYISSMVSSPAFLKGEQPRFRLIGGEPSLDFANTAEWNGDELLIELLPDYESLVRWAELAGVIDAHTARKLRSRSRRNREEADRALLRARELRRALHAAFSASASAHGGSSAGRGLPNSIAALDVLLHEALKHLRVAGEGGRVRFDWDGMGGQLDCIEWPVIWNAAQFLASEAAGSVHVCAGRNCGWVYVDRSRNGLRRWCSMETCGSREKAHRHYARVKNRKQAVSGGNIFALPERVGSPADRRESSAFHSSNNRTTSSD